ncbi:malto-oligosyltrehalose trehalohydrolase [Mucilaginibacter koreensis]
MSIQKLISRRPGLCINNNGEAEILVWAPEAQTAGIKLCSTKQVLPLQQLEYGYWTLTTPLLKAGDWYKVVINDKEFLPDPASLSQPEGVHGASVVVNLNSFKWTDDSWKNIPLADYLLYELHTGTFSPEGTFAGIEKKLDYLLELGITAIEIMPIAQFPGNRNWGYDGVYPYAVQDSYGGAQGLQQLVNACHNKGIAVVLDVVYNHVGPEGNYLNSFGKYFTDKYHTPWGNAINVDDEWSDGVRQYIIQNALMWFRDFHVDALRLDAVHAIKDFGAEHILSQLKTEVDQLIQQTGRPHYLIVECDLNDPRFINPQSKNGLGMDAQWIDEFHHALRITAGGDRSGYYEDFNGIADLAKAYQDAYVYSGQYSSHRRKLFGGQATENGGQQFIVFSQNHDQVGNRMLGERSSQLFSFEMQKLMAGAVLVAPYLPMLFMGEEWSEPHPFLYFVSHTDPQLAEAVRKGRKQEFAAFHAEGEAPDPMDEETFNQSKLQWNLVNEGQHQVMFNFYKTLITLRKQTPALHVLDRNSLKVSCDEQAQTLILQRWHKDNKVTIAMNFSDQPQQVDLPNIKAEWKLLMASADVQWNGPGFNSNNAGGIFDLSSQSFCIYGG